MRDLIWTIIVIWLVYRLVDIFKKKPQQQQYSQNQSQQNQSNTPDDKIKSAIHKQADKEGEYVDFEEIK